MLIKLAKIAGLIYLPVLAALDIQIAWGYWASGKTGAAVLVTLIALGYLVFTGFAGYSWYKQQHR